MSTLIDLTNKRFSRLTAMSRGPNDKSGKARWWCLCDCGEGCLVSGTHLQTEHTRSCGCLNIEKSTERAVKIGHGQVREKNPNWNPNLTEEEREANRDYPEYLDWRIAVFERDLYTCQKCKTRSGYINAHHIESFNDNPELRTEISNGITLCQVCHKNFHHQYGRGNNTRKQLDKFIKE